LEDIPGLIENQLGNGLLTQALKEMGEKDKIEKPQICNRVYL